jgi:hypothetical protein
MTALGLPSGPMSNAHHIHSLNPSLLIVTQTKPIPKIITASEYEAELHAKFTY